MGTLIGLFIKSLKYILIAIINFTTWFGALIMPFFVLIIFTKEFSVEIFLAGLSPIFLWIAEFYKKKVFQSSESIENTLYLVGIPSFINYKILPYIYGSKSFEQGFIEDSNIISKYQFIYPVLCFFYFLFFLLKKKMINKRKKNRKFSTKFEDKKNRDVKGFTLETKAGTIYLDNPQRGIYIQGGAGSGKSASIFEPIINQISKQNYSGILYDFKSPELIDKVRNSYKNSHTIDFKIIDFKNAHTSNRVNPIDSRYLTKSIVAIEYAQALVNNMIPESIKQEDFWARNTKMIIAGTIWFLKEKHPNFCTLPHVISLLLHTDIYDLLEKITEDYEAGGMVTTLKSAMDRKAENQVAGVLSSVQNALSTLNNKEVFWLLSANDFSLELNDNEKPTFLAIGNDSSLPNTYSPLISLIISVALRQMNTPGKGKSIVLLDEAPTIYVPNLEQIPATARSNGISTVLGVQDFSQLIEKYGKDKAEIIISNLGNQFFGRTTNHNTANMIKNIFSKEDKTFETSSIGSGSSGEFIHLNTNKNKGRNESIQERDRVKVSDLINLEPGEFYGIIAEGAPREFLKEKLIQQRIDDEPNKNIYITEKEMKDNYFKIIEEAKNILK